MAGFDENKCRDYHLSPGLTRINIETTKGWFFQRVYLYIRAIARHELSTRSIRVHNSSTVHDNLWALKIRKFYFKISLVITPLSPQRYHDALHTKIDMWLTPKSFEKGSGKYAHRIADCEESSDSKQDQLF